MPARKGSAKEISAFTFTELIIIIAILLILGSFAIVKYSGTIDKGRSAEAYAVLADIAAAETAYHMEYGVYTTGDTWSNLDRYTDEPVSDNFTFTLNDAYFGRAQPKTGKGSINYYMCFDGSSRGTNQPACPS